MSFELHIPIDDISESDLEADLREITQLANPNTNQEEGAGLGSRYPEFRAGLNAYPAAPIPVVGFASQDGRLWADGILSPGGGVRGEPSAGRGNGGDSGSGVRSFSSSGGTGRHDERYGVGGAGAGKQVSNIELALARSEIESSRDKLYQEKMREEFLSGMKTADVDREEDNVEDNEEVVPVFLKENKGKNVGVETSKTDVEVAKKRIFVTALKKKHHKKLQNAITTTASPNKALFKLMSDLKDRAQEDEVEDKSKTAVKDFADDKKIQKYKNIELKKPGDTVKASRPYEEKTQEKSKAEPARVQIESSGDTTHNEEKEEGEEVSSGRASPTDAGAMVDTIAERRKKPKKQGRHHKKHKQTFGKKTKLDNEAVAMMIAMDRQTNRNQTGRFHLVDKGKDRVDLPLTGTDGGWRHKVHGQRDIVVAGAIVMCLGLIVIIVSLIALVRRRFLKSSARSRRSNKNNNQRYRTLGSASETEILRKPQRSLFPLASSDEDDDNEDDDDSSTSGEEIVYHQRKINRSF